MLCGSEFLMLFSSGMFIISELFTYWENNSGLLLCAVYLMDCYGARRVLDIFIQGIFCVWSRIKEAQNS